MLLLIYLFILFIYLFICLFIYLFIYFIYLFVYLFIFLFVVFIFRNIFIYLFIFSLLNPRQFTRICTTNPERSSKYTNQFQYLFCR